MFLEATTKLVNYVYSTSGLYDKQIHPSATPTLPLDAYEDFIRAKISESSGSIIPLVTDNTLPDVPHGHLLRRILSSPLAIAMWNICSIVTDDSVFPITLPRLNISHWGKKLGAETESPIQSLHYILPQISLIPLTFDFRNNGLLLMPFRDVAIGELDSGLLQLPTGSECISIDRHVILRN
nr:unnamed protein product [Spirometra erinaceieuropaei]